jgi:hypothetical protein
MIISRISIRVDIDRKAAVILRFTLPTPTSYLGPSEKLYRRSEDEKGHPFLMQCLHHSRVPQALRSAHDTSGHIADALVGSKIRREFWWPTMVQDIKLYIKSCKTCALWAQRRRAQPLLALDSLYLIYY